MLKIKKLRIRAAILMFFNIAVLQFMVIPLFSQDNEFHDTTSSYLSIADSLFFEKKYEIAIANYRSVMETHQYRNWTIWYKGFTGLRKSRIKQQKITRLINEIDVESNILNIDDKFIAGKVLFYSGFHNGNIGNIYDAIKKYKLALKQFESISNKESKISKFLLITYKNLSINYSRLGDQKSAIRYCELGIEMIENEDSELCVFNLNKSRFLFYDKKYKDAVIQLEKSLEICNTKQDSFYIHQYLAQVYIKQDSLKIAKRYLESYADWKEKKGYQYFEIYGDYYKKMNLLNEAQKKYELALERLENHPSLRIYLKILTRYADLQYMLNKKENAVSNAQLILSYNYPALDSLNINDRPQKKEGIPDIWIIEALYIKAKYFRENYLETNDQFSLGEAKFYYDLLLSHFDKLKSEYYSSSSQYRTGAYSQKIYSEIITFFVEQYNANKNEDDLKNAFSLAQRANSFVLKNAVSDRKALELAGVQKDSLEEYLQLASKVATDASDDSENTVTELIAFDNYKESLYSNYPSYGKYNKDEEISLEELKSSLTPNTLVLKYYYFNEVITVIGISKDLVFAENIPFTSTMDSIINLNFETLSQNSTNDSLANNYLSNSKKVYDLVLGDLLSKYNLNKIDHLTIIPDGPLKKVAFNALAINETGDWNNPNSFLISKYAINYLYYCSQLESGNAKYNSKDGFIGFGVEYEDDFLKEIINEYKSNFKENTNNSRTISLSPLKYADDEVLASADILNGTSYLNADVTPTQVISTINNFDVIHFSAHAFVHDEDYLNSFVVLNKDEDENFQLKYSDILNLDIDSELVVLSACQTSSGKSVSGEGLMSLSRAFVQSGSKSTVGAYWNAPDYATKELMTLFYSKLKEGMTKSKAMQQAQIEYLTNDKISSPTIRSPFYWASWALYGNDQPLNMDSSILKLASWTTFGLLFIIGVLLFFLAKYFQKNRNFGIS